MTLNKTTQKLLPIFGAAFFMLLQISQVYAQPSIKFDTKTHKFPKTPAGETINFTYPFENTGNEPLIITDVKVTCPCTKFEYPKAPVMPNSKGEIKVSFDTKSKIGYQDRTLEVYCNDPDSPISIRFKGMVDHKNPTE